MYPCDVAVAIARAKRRSSGVLGGRPAHGSCGRGLRWRACLRPPPVRPRRPRRARSRGSRRAWRRRSWRWPPSARAARGPEPAGRSPRPRRCRRAASSWRAPTIAPSPRRPRRSSGAPTSRSRCGGPSTSCSRSARRRPTSPSSRRSWPPAASGSSTPTPRPRRCVAEGAVKALEALVRTNLSVTPGDERLARIARAREAAADAARRAGETA